MSLGGLIFSEGIQREVFLEEMVGGKKRWGGLEGGGNYDQM